MERESRSEHIVRKELRKLLPANKDDVAAVQSLVTLDCAVVQPLLYDILKWIRQESWPVAKPICEFLVSMGPRLSPEVRSVLRSRDDCWKATILKKIVKDWPREEIVLLSPELFMMATDGQSRGADLLALRLLAQHGIGDPQWIAGWLEFKQDHHRARLSEIEEILKIGEKGAA
jgi:Domain of unknown function (DUF5071)